MSVFLDSKTSIPFWKHNSFDRIRLDCQIWTGCTACPLPWNIDSRIHHHAKSYSFDTRYLANRRIKRKIHTGEGNWIFQDERFKKNPPDQSKFECLAVQILWPYHPWWAGFHHTGELSAHKSATMAWKAKMTTFPHRPWCIPQSVPWPLREAALRRKSTIFASFFKKVAKRDCILLVHLLQ